MVDKFYNRLEHFEILHTLNSKFYFILTGPGCGMSCRQNIIKFGSSSVVFDSTKMLMFLNVDHEEINLLSILSNFKRHKENNKFHRYFKYSDLGFFIGKNKVTRVSVGFPW